jgi:hypothetical protein
MLFIFVFFFYQLHISGQGSVPNQPSDTDCNLPECKVDFDDSSWRTLNVPHDFVIEGTFNPAAGGYFFFLAFIRSNFFILFINTKKKL